MPALPLKTRYVFLLFIWICCLASFNSFGQINLITGVSIGLFQNDNFDREIDNYNQSFSTNQLTTELKPIRSLLGFNLGARSKFDLIAFEAGIIMRFQNSNSEWNDQNNEISSNKFSLRSNTYYLGTEIFLGSSILSLGGNLGYDNFKIKYSTTGQDSAQNLDQQNGWSSRFFLGINVPGNGSTQLVIRPFAEVDWTGKSLDNFFDVLSNSPASQSINFNQFGISLLLSNGGQY